MMLAIAWILTAWIAQFGLRDRNGQLHKKSSYGSLGRSMTCFRPSSSTSSTTLSLNNGDGAVNVHREEDDLPPPDFTVIDDDDGGEAMGSISVKHLNEIEGAYIPTTERQKANHNPKRKSNDDFALAARWPKPPPRPNRSRAVPGPELNEASSWMDRNTKYSSVGTGKSFREDFRGTRVFVQGIPEGISWQTLKDHFRTAGDVVFASVSYGGNTGIVQYETTDQAAKAIQIMRDYPLEGAKLFVREDLQDNKPEKRLGKKKRNNNESGGVFWQCASPDYATVMDSEKVETIESILRSRDQARRRRNFAAADSMREQLRYDFGVQLDDRSHLWWISSDDEDRRSLGQAQWEQIKTDHDGVVDSSYVFSLLKQRDTARRQRDFTTADALLEKAYMAPKEEGVSLRIHDESRTWRVWLDRPQSTARSLSNTKRDKEASQLLPDDEKDDEASYRAKCIALMEQFDPERIPEVTKLLDNFPASSVWPRLSQRYL